jgi:hypothetical protein
MHTHICKKIATKHKMGEEKKIGNVCGWMRGKEGVR